MDSENSLLNTNNLIPFSIIEKLSNSIACVYYNPNYSDEPPVIGTGFFIKLELKEVVTPYFCTAKHVIEDVLKADFMARLKNGIRLWTLRSDSDYIGKGLQYDNVEIANINQ